MLGAARLRAAYAKIRPAARLSTYLSLPTWDARYLQLGAYREASGDCHVPFRYVTDGATLGWWVSAQRRAFKARKLSPERIARLEAAGFVWDPRAEEWDAHFKLLQTYHAAHGDCAVPSNFATADGTKLGQWVNKQREAYKAGKLSPDRVERLVAVAFVWDVQADWWDAHFEQLTAYLAAHGDCAVPYRFVNADGTKLGEWVHTQRKTYKAGEQSLERVEWLEAVGFAWRG
ncbi:helicase-associated [Pelagophyceae sp. CCMP2097]|nr:helicase-associated [Pelagophyceae sp. CCMP2097]